MIKQSLITHHSLIKHNHWSHTLTDQTQSLIIHHSLIKHYLLPCNVLHWTLDSTSLLRQVHQISWPDLPGTKLCLFSNVNKWPLSSFKLIHQHHRTRTSQLSHCLAMEHFATHWFLSITYQNSFSRNTLLITSYLTHQTPAHIICPCSNCSSLSIYTNITSVLYHLGCQ